MHLPHPMGEARKLALRTILTGSRMHRPPLPGDDKTLGLLVDEDTIRTILAQINDTE